MMVQLKKLNLNKSQQPDDIHLRFLKELMTKVAILLNKMM